MNNIKTGELLIVDVLGSPCVLGWLESYDETRLVLWVRAGGRMIQTIVPWMAATGIPYIVDFEQLNWMTPKDAQWKL